MHISLKLLALSLTLSSALLAAPKPPGRDLSGAWRASLTLPATGLAIEDLVVTLTQSGKQLRGSIYFPKPKTTVALTGAVSGNTLTLSSSVTKGMGVAITAFISDPARITGTALLTYEMPRQGQKQDRTVLEMTR